MERHAKIRAALSAAVIAFLLVLATQCAFAQSDSTQSLAESLKQRDAAIVDSGDAALGNR